MELITPSTDFQVKEFEAELPFIEANTLPVTLDDMRRQHIIPVFTKDNQALISQHEFVTASYDVLSSVYSLPVEGPFVRVSHPIKGRVPSARHKKVHELLPEEETIYYERMMFVYIIPSYTKIIDGKELKLVIGGVKSYNKDNVNKIGAAQHFSFFIGFQVKVCSNLCIWTDGVKEAICVHSIEGLKQAITEVFTSYDPEQQLTLLSSLGKHALTTDQFAHLLGKCKMYHHLPKESKLKTLPCGLNDTQLNLVTKNYFQDDHFSGSNDGISLWSLYNIFTGACKSSYIDTIVDNNIQAGRFFQHLSFSLESGNPSWYLL